MDLTEDSFEEKKARSKKMMLWFGMISMVMTFAGLTSAYVVSKNRPDWLEDFQLPTAFYWSTLVIILSSFTLFLARNAIVKKKKRNGTSFLIATFILGLLFVMLQFHAFSQILDMGYWFTFAGSTVTTSFIYLIVCLHLVHLAAGLIVLLVLIYNHFKQRYQPGQMLGFELGETFWHFLDAVWILLIIFFYFFR